MDDDLLQKLYIWVDKIPLSRIKKNISRDFSDGVLMAEVIKYFFPRLVDVHNFQTCNSVESKIKNWELLNWKVFKKMNFELSDDVIENLAIAKPGTIEKVLLLLRTKIERIVIDETGKSYELKVESDHMLQTHIKTNYLKSPSYKPSFKKTNYCNNNNNNQSPKCKIIQTNSKLELNKKNCSPKNCMELNHDISNSDYILKKNYDEKVQECFSLEEAVDIYRAKVKKLESLLILKDKRINELQNKVNLMNLSYN